MKTSLSAQIKLNNEEFFVESNQSLELALKKLGIDPESVLAVRSGTMLDINETINPGDKIKLVHVISGGNIGY